MITLISWCNNLSEMLTSSQKTKESMNYLAFVIFLIHQRKNSTNYF